MIRNNAQIAVRLAAGLTLLSLSANAILAQSYDTHDLGTTGGYLSRAFGLNNLNRVIGSSYNADAALHGFLWSQGINEILPLPGDTQSEAFSINDAGTVVGINYDMGQEVLNGFLYANGVSTSLGAIAAHGVNLGGEVVGYVSVYDSSFGWVDHAARWSTGVIADVGTLGGHFSYLMAINDQSQAVGSSFLANDASWHAAHYKGGAWVDLGTLGGTNSQAYAISNSGFVAGYSDTAAGAPHAFLYQVNSSGGVVSRRDLGELGGGYSYAYDVNESGQVVGTSYDRAFLWNGSTLIDLNTQIPANSGWELNSAWAINDQGAIAGVGKINGIPHAFLLTPKVCADLNGDHIVDLSDLATLLAAFGCSGANCPGDLDHGGTTDLGDLAALLAQFGTSCP